MSDSLDLLEKIKAKKAKWSDFSKFLKLDFKELKPFLKLAQEIKFQNFGNKLKIYIPNKKFPAISVTGRECALHCEHCNEKYLHNMKPILNSIDLENFLLEHAKNGGIGVLLSGGCEPDGSVPLLNFLDTIKKVKNQTDLIINTHTGLLNEETAKKLADAKVDIVSFDINVDEDIIKNIYHLDKDLKDYKRAINLLNKYQLNIVPHICIGLYYGKLHKELESLKFIKETNIDPNLIVIIALIPPKSSRMLFERPKPVDIAKVISVVRFLFPKTEISLGCMRPRGNIKCDIEKNAIRAGITRIEIPSKKTLLWLNKTHPDINLKFYSACCAIPHEFEKFAKSNVADIRRYINI